MAKVVVHPGAVDDLLRSDPKLKAMLLATGQQVAATAQATAQSAQLGPEGRLTGYAEAGFEVELETRFAGRPRVNIRSLADIKTALAAHFYTQRRDGVGHLRAALYSITSRG